MSMEWVAIIVLYFLVFLFKTRSAYYDALEFEIAELTRKLQDAEKSISDLESRIDELDSDEENDDDFDIENIDMHP